MELKATQDDLAKAKAGLEASRSEVANLAGQLEVAKVSAAAGAEPDTAIAEEIERLTKELSHAHDDLAASHDVLSLTKQSLEEITNNQAKELEEAAKGRAEEVTRLKTLHEQEVNTLVGQKSDLAIKLSDLEGEVATLKASTAVERAASPRPNGNAPPTSPGVTKEELQRMHEAHNAKLNDLQAEHDKAIKAIKQELETHQSKAEDLQQEVGRKAMEIQYLEQEQEESTDTITRYVTFVLSNDLFTNIYRLFKVERRSQQSQRAIEGQGRVVCVFYFCSLLLAFSFPPLLMQTTIPDVKHCCYIGLNPYRYSISSPIVRIPTSFIPYTVVLIPCTCFTSRFLFVHIYLAAFP